jgi:hypothetical protein
VARKFGSCRPFYVAYSIEEKPWDGTLKDPSANTVSDLNECIELDRQVTIVNGIQLLDRMSAYIKTSSRLQMYVSNALNFAINCAADVGSVVNVVRCLALEIACFMLIRCATVSESDFFTFLSLYLHQPLMAFLAVIC